ncbi:hypothetical protein [Rhizobium jaguaris]|uniref:hypothetical protein n=1 Tax=Rhizobium jaguaris TaxID=1312183 RepID=UPI0013C3F727|nr:hypothetical protein [Rhizobium jaguaris]
MPVYLVVDFQHPCASDIQQQEHVSAAFFASRLNGIKNRANYAGRVRKDFLCVSP